MQASCDAVVSDSGHPGLGTGDQQSIDGLRDPQRSPDGKWVAYVVSRAVKDGDKNDTDFLVPLATENGGRHIHVE
jgi:hypothetical protein